MACQEFRKEVDAVYPEPMSMLHHGTLASLAIESTSSASRRLHSRRLDNAAMPGRYRTQPVTFHEIKEVDEEVNEEESSGAATTAQSEEDLMQKKFHKLRQRNKSRPTIRRQLLRPSNSGEEVDGDPVISDAELLSNS